jgi:Raf kinase inhibitor-like YbhB/YbcL family protein
LGRLRDPARRRGHSRGRRTFTQGRNDLGNEGYSGPLPPEGHGSHHYCFWLYALDTEIGAGPGLTRAVLLDAIGDHVIEQARMVGTYRR